MAVAEAHFCFPISNEYSDVEAAPLLCAGLIEYRSLSMVGERVEFLDLERQHISLLSLPYISDVTYTRLHVPVIRQLNNLR